MRKEFIYKFYLILCGVLLGLNTHAQNLDLVLDDFHYILHENGTATLAGINSDNPAEFELGDVIIPVAVSKENKEYKVIEIGESAFFLCQKLTSITIPEGVTNIGPNAFAQCTALVSISIPESIKTIGKNAFLKTKWYDSLSDGEVYIHHILYSYKGDMPQETSVTIKEGTVSIAEWAFANCENLIAATFPASLKKICDYAFNGCKQLKEISLPTKLAYIGKEVLAGTAIKKLTIPASVSYIDGRFAPSGLEEIRFEGVTPPQTTSPSFIPSDAVYYIPYESYMAYFNAGLIPFGTVEYFSTVKTLEGEYIYPVTTSIKPDGVGGTILLNGEQLSMTGIKEGTTVKFVVTADSGYLIDKMWVGTGYPIEPDNLRSFTYTIQSLSKYVSLGASFIKETSHISNQSTEDPHVYISNGILKIKNTQEIVPIKILNLAGQTIYQGMTDSYEGISLLEGMYIIKVGTETYKIIMKQ